MPVKKSGIVYEKWAQTVDLICLISCSRFGYGRPGARDVGEVFNPTVKIFMNSSLLDLLLSCFVFFLSKKQARTHNLKLALGQYGNLPKNNHF